MEELNVRALRFWHWRSDPPAILLGGWQRISRSLRTSEKIGCLEAPKHIPFVGIAGATVRRASPTIWKTAATLRLLSACPDMLGTPGFIGPQNIYMLTTTADQQQPGTLQLVGSWTAFPVREPNNYSNSVAPNSINQDGTITVQFYDSNGYNYQPYAEVVFGSSLADPNACRIRYDRGTGTANHILSVYGTDFTVPALQGAAPVGSPGASVRGASCTLDIGHSYVVQESGTGAIVNVALTFANTGAINTYAQSFDRQNMGGALRNDVINVPVNGFTLSQVSAVTVQQSGSPVSFMLNVPATGNFSASVNLASSAPSGVAVTFQQNPLSVPSSSATSVQVTASSAALAGSGVITITATGGGITYVLNIPLTVTAETIPVSPSFALSGPQINSSAQQATFTVTLTGFNGFPPNQPVTLTEDPFSMTTVTAQFPQTVYVPGSFTATVGLLSGGASFGGSQCALINATALGLTEQVLLCVNAGSSTILSVPSSADTITVPSGGTTVIYGAVNSTSSPTFSQSASCPSGISPCDAGASFGAISNGTVPITVSSGSLPSGTTFTETFSANGVVAARVSATVGNGGATPSFKLSDQNLPFTYNDGNLSARFNYTCVNCTNDQLVLPPYTSTNACSAGSNVTVTVGVNGNYGGTGVYLQFLASTSAQVGTRNITCKLLNGTNISAGQMTIKSAAAEPTITSVCLTQSPNPTDPNCTPPVLFPGANAITINGTNLVGTNTNAAPTLHFGDNGQTGIPLSGSALSWQSTRIDASVNVQSTIGTGQYAFDLYVFPLGFQGFNVAGYPQSNPKPVTASGKVTITGLQVSQQEMQSPPTGTTAPTVVPINIANTTLAFPTSNSACANATSAGMICVLKNSGTITVSVQGLQPTSASGLINWIFQPDMNNFTISSGSPALSGTTGPAVTFGPSLAGDFLLVAWVDTNGDGQFNQGEQIGVAQIAIVQTTFQSGSSFFTVKNTLVGTGVAGIATDPTRDLTKAPMQLQAWYLLEGGGSTRVIGTSGVNIGNVGNLLSDTFQVNYPGNPNGYGNEAPGGPLPMLDTLAANPGTGASTAFRATSVPAPLASSPLLPSAGGALLGIQSGDAPVFMWLNTHMYTLNDWDSTEGTVTFTEFVAAYSATFPLTYLPLNKANWSLTLTGDNNAGWDTDSDSSIIGDLSLSDATNANLQVFGLSYSRQNSIVYTPKP